MEKSTQGIICPYCQAVVGQAIDYSEGTPKCPKCNKEFNLRTEYEIIYITTTKEEPELPKRF